MLHYLANCSVFVFVTYNYFLALYPAVIEYFQIIVTRKNLVWNLACGYFLCHCKTFLLVPDSTEFTKILVTVKCSTLLVSSKIR